MTDNNNEFAISFLKLLKKAERDGLPKTSTQQARDLFEKGHEQEALDLISDASMKDIERLRAKRKTLK